jgi:hypothetical protein
MILVNIFLLLALYVLSKFEVVVYSLIVLYKDILGSSKEPETKRREYSKCILVFPGRTDWFLKQVLFLRLKNAYIVS